MTAAQSFPGATGVTLLDVYDWPGTGGPGTGQPRPGE